MVAREGWYRLATGLGHVALRGLRITTRAEGLEQLPDGPVLLAANHVSYPDFVFIQRAIGPARRRVRYMCRHDVWNAAWRAHAMDRMQHVPVDRQAPAAAYLQARRLLRAGETVCAFPEAGISYSYAVRSLMPGVAALARETGVPVVPVAVWGSQRIYSVGRVVDGREPPPDWTRGRLVDVRFGTPISARPDDDLTEWTRGLGHVLTEMLEGLQMRPEHRPRPGEWAPWYPAHLGGHAPDRAEAATLDSVPTSAVTPTWGPPGPTPDDDAEPPSPR